MTVLTVAGIIVRVPDELWRIDTTKLNEVLEVIYEGARRTVANRHNETERGFRGDISSFRLNPYSVANRHNETERGFRGDISSFRLNPYSARVERNTARENEGLDCPNINIILCLVTWGFHPLPLPFCVSQKKKALSFGQQSSRLQKGAKANWKTRANLNNEGRLGHFDNGSDRTKPIPKAKFITPRE
ncbi:hypothetical protein QE152_g27098 [Popillia japonica]|uniref:Uncharacterized protein n=1 Tax=Popillia japonica TaxID=7064 RepID=A0AAW1JXD1_POPJA